MSWRINVACHLTFTALRSKTPATANIDATVTCLLMWMAHKQSYVTVGLMLNRRRYLSEIAVFDMSTIILHNTFKTATPLVEATVSETLLYFLPFGDYQIRQ